MWHYLAFVVFVAVSVHHVKATKHPHIIILLADDLGHNDVSFLGSEQIPTPNLDALAYDGIILDNFYVQRICTPSRAALLTGRHPTQLGLQVGVITGAQPYGLGLNETLLPEYLKKLGYSTHAFGKWHLGFYAKQFTPTFRGFDSFFGYLQGREDYWDHTYKLGPDWGLDLRRDEEIVKTRFGQYGTDVFTEEAVKVIRSHDPDTPLFIYLPQQGVHAGNEQTKTPLEAPWKYVKKFSHIQHKQRRIYAGMVAAVDESMGAITRALYEKGMLNDSIIFFSTDNGGPAAGFDKNQACNWPLRGMKYTLWEGGVRGASFIWSPLFKNSGYVSRHLMQIEDIFPTLLHAAGYDTSTLPRNIFGKDMWDVLSEDGPERRKEVFHNSNPKTNVKAIRVGDMKLVMSSRRGITAELDGWYRPPSVETGAACRHRILDDPDVGRVSACEEAYNGTLPAEYGVPPEHVFQTDLPLVLSAIGRPRRPDVPYVIKCTRTPEDRPCELGVKPCLFNVTADPCEYNNLADRFPELVRTLQARIKVYEGQAAPPRNKAPDPKGNPKYHNGVWEPWIKLSEEQVREMTRGKHL